MILNLYQSALTAADMNAKLLASLNVIMTLQRTKHDMTDQTTLQHSRQLT